MTQTRRRFDLVNTRRIKWTFNDGRADLLELLVVHSWALRRNNWTSSKATITFSSFHILCVECHSTGFHNVNFTEFWRCNDVKKIIMKYHWHFIAGTTGTWLILTYINTYRETSGTRWPRNAWFSLQSSGAHWTCQTLVSRWTWSASVSCGSSLTLLSALQAKKKEDLWLLCVRGRKTDPAAAEAFERPILVKMYLTINSVYSRPMNLPSSVSFYVHLFTKSCSLKKKKSPLWHHKWHS